MRISSIFPGACALLFVLAVPALSAPGVNRPDLADIAQGRYAGEVISDARGASQSDVHLIVRKVAPNQVEVSSDYKRLPVFRARLTRAMQTIQNADGKEVFLLDLSKTPHRLDVTVDDASWSGSRTEAG
jgi:hypothetical protein